MSFWTDTKVADDFTPEDKYFYLYLMTNPHTNLAGCYEISFTQMSTETGYTKDAIEKLIKRMERVHQVIRYSPATKELLILNWKKYNWTNSPTFRKPLLNEISQIKNPDFRLYLEQSEQILERREEVKNDFEALFQEKNTLLNGRDTSKNVIQQRINIFDNYFQNLITTR